VGIVVVGSRDGVLVAAEAATGAVRWRWRASGALEGSPVVAGRQVVVGSLDGRLAVLDLDSARQAQVIDLGSPIGTTPAVAGDLVVVTTEDGRVWAFAAGTA
jgi:outer membrane protein assembly factor BamB